MPGRTRAALVALGLLFGFALWTAFSLGWAESSERTANELARVAAYLGVFALGVCLVTRRRAGAKHVLDGVTFGLALVCALAVLSRLHMAWFPPTNSARCFPGSKSSGVSPIRSTTQIRPATPPNARPDAASPLLQEALVLEQQGKLRAAAATTRKEGAEWSTWFILARIEAERGRIGPALRAYARAHRANPLYGLLKP